MKKLIIGGDFGEIPKASSVMSKLSTYLGSDIVNGGSIDDLKNSKLSGYDLSIWSVNVDNTEEKFYPKKDQGSVLICTKVIYGDRTDADAIGRIFQMHGNAVIAIHSESRPFKFKLLDALGNIWVETSELKELARSIEKFYTWNLQSIRYPSNRKELPNILQDEFSKMTMGIRSSKNMKTLIDINKRLADKIEVAENGRYFGNLSTRCMLLFPSLRKELSYFFVSKRNTNKRRLTPEDMMLVYRGDNEVIKITDDKPSIDTPIQLEIYKELDHVYYMIHGHAYVNDAPFTETYCPCGDMREVKEVIELLRTNSVINLVNHGFLIAVETLEELDDIINNRVFVNKELGIETVNV